MLISRARGGLRLNKKPRFSAVTNAKKVGPPLKAHLFSARYPALAVVDLDNYLTVFETKSD
jgi:hypothetical protein